MKWRCEWCGRPHESNDRPCESCGHGKFERAIVREFETVDTGTTYVWACPNCGREHVKNTPPCSRCGNPDLEKVEQRYDDVDRELEVPSWLAVAKPYAPVIALVAAIVLAAVLFLTGVLPASLLPGIGPPAMPDAPGEGSEAEGIDLDAVATAVHDELDAERRDGGEAERRYDEGLVVIATYENRRYVASAYDEEPGDRAEWDDFDHSCSSDVGVVPLRSFDRTIDEYDRESELAADVATALLESSFGANVREGFDAEGIDVHVGPDGEIFVAYAAC